ncbi:MAG: hypothetical protein IT386_10715 [Deltaproteobacteria bacterium]|nr:hypothetical protein [Deltaproteobacteria bacterium]
MQFYAAHPVLAQDLIQQLFLWQRENPEVGGLGADYLAHVQVLVEAAQRRGEVRSDRPSAQLAAAFFAHYAFWVQAWLVERSVSSEAAEALLRAALELQIEGVRPRRVKSQR